MNKLISKFIIISALLSVFSLSSLALSSIPEDISQKAKDTIGNFVHALESQKQVYGISEN